MIVSSRCSPVSHRVSIVSVGDEHEHESRTRLFKFCLSETGHIATMPKILEVAASSHREPRARSRVTNTVVLRFTITLVFLSTFIIHPCLNARVDAVSHSPVPFCEPTKGVVSIRCFENSQNVEVIGGQSLRRLRTNRRKNPSVWTDASLQI